MSTPVRTVGPLSEWHAEPDHVFVEEAIGALLLRRAREQGDRPFAHWLVDGVRQQLTYAELAARATPLAAAIAGATPAGARVAIWGRNCVDWIIVEFATALAGRVLAPINTLWTDAEVDHAIRLTSPSLVIVGRDRAGASLLDRVRPLAGATPLIDLDALDEWVAGAPSSSLPEVSKNDPFVIIFTSGTTGRSKGATISHRSALNAARERNACEVIVDGDCYLNAVPFFHAGGCISVLLGALTDGGAMVVVEKWDPVDVVTMLDTGVVTRIGGVPTMFVDLMSRVGDDARQYGIVSISIGGTKVPEQMIVEVQRVFGAPVDVTFAMSESAAITSTIAGIDEPAVLATTVGRPMAGVDLRIVDEETGDVVPLGVPGEIWSRSPYTMLGYWDAPDATAVTITPDGFLRTGDLASMDERGNLTFLGRSKDIIIRGGENIYPAEVEECLLEHPDVVGAVLVGVEDPRLGERPVGVIVRAPGTEVTGDDLAAFLADKVARFKIPDTWRFVDSYPTTALGKVRRFVVRDDTITEMGGTSHG